MKRRLGLLGTLGVVATACFGGSAVRDDAPAAVEVFGTWRGVDADRFAEVLAGFEESTGIEVRYVGSVDFVDDLLGRLDDVGDPPDVAMVPQFGLVRRLADDGHIVPIAPEVREAVDEQFDEERAALGAVGDTLFAVPYRITVKSLVWYSPTVFDERGWRVPTSMDELEALVGAIDTESELAPWCLGLEAGSATGWVATDWTEDLVLRSAGADVYERWATGEIGFADARITAGFEQFRALALDPGRSAGGTKAIVETPVDHAIQPLLTEPPGCALHRQADFAVNWLPDDTEVGPGGDVDFFVLPALDGAEAPPLVLGGNQAVQFRSAPDVDQLMAYLASAEAAAVWAAHGGFLSPNRTVPIGTYPEAYLRELTVALDEATEVVLDASDGMPPEIGSDLLWDRITAWVAGSIDHPTFAAEIDDARSALEE